MGADQRPAELLGWGPVHAELACDLARSLRSWWCVLTGADGAPQAIVPIRRRPTAAVGCGVRVRCGCRSTRPGCACSPRRPGSAWSSPAGRRSWPRSPPGLASTPAGPPNTDPAARLPGAALRRWIHIRDRRCVFPGCRAPAHRADTDHSIEHARGGATTDAGLASACRHDHGLRHEGGWTVEHTEPGQLTWISPLGRRYRSRPPPGLLDLPEPRPGAIDERDPEPDPEQSPTRVGPHQLPPTRTAPPPTTAATWPRSRPGTWTGSSVGPAAPTTSPHRSSRNALGAGRAVVGRRFDHWALRPLLMAVWRAGLQSIPV